jgi:hypothetical protein
VSGSVARRPWSRSWPARNTRLRHGRVLDCRDASATRHIRESGGEVADALAVALALGLVCAEALAGAGVAAAGAFAVGVRGPDLEGLPEGSIKILEPGLRQAARAQVRGLSATSDLPLPLV